MTVPMGLRRLIRPLIPDAVMARYRLHQHSRQVRANVDVVLEDESARRRWLLVTPDTYRVRRSSDFGEAPDHAVFRPEDTPPADVAVVVCVDQEEAGDATLAARLLSDSAIDVGVVGSIEHLGLVRRRRSEPRCAPSAIAVRREALDEVGGVPDGRHPLPGLLTRLRDAGRKIALVPVPERHGMVFRSDPITGPAAIVAAAVPMHDVGGGGRGAQITLELLRRGYHVTYVALFGTAESVDLGLRYIHPRLEQVRLDEFDGAAHAARAEDPALALFEVPAPAFLPLMEACVATGYRTVYDVIDDWSAPGLGGDWYRADVERSFVLATDLVVGSAPDLVARLTAHGRDDAILIANAVNQDVFGKPDTGLPDDFPVGGDPVIGYHGSLYGDWFNWEALAAVAAAHPTGRVVVIGDDKAPRPDLPSNVHVLGLKPQVELPAYVGRFDVGIVPFTVSETTHAVSPLKVYEYLACGVPVAAPPLRSLHGMNGVYVADDLPTAVSAALTGPPPDGSRALAEHSWTTRVAALLEAAELPGSWQEAAPATVVVRPPEHYGKAERSP